jgi:FK506-binding protein 1
MGDMRNKPQKGNRVKVHYDVFLSTNKKKIESSRDEKEPYEFMLGRGEVIEYWEQVLPQLTIGQKVRFECPATEVFGSSLAINPADKLIFVLELISFV